eukprot:5904922-Heterocapsa_arctica.AAC.1
MGKSKPGELTWFRAIVTTRIIAPCATKRPLGRPKFGHSPNKTCLGPRGAKPGKRSPGNRLIWNDAQIN